MAEGPFITHTGSAKQCKVTPGRMNMTLENAVKSVVGNNIRCYVCKIDVTEGIVTKNSVDFGIRKVGKKYRRVLFHISCEDKSES